MRLIQGDCLEIMDSLISEGVKVDAIITDPPYGTTACKWDSVIPFDEMWPRLELLRKERTPIVLFGSEPFSSALRLSNLKEYKYDWIWDRARPCNAFTAKYRPLKYHEIASVFYMSNYYPQMTKGDMMEKARGGKSLIHNTDNKIERYKNDMYYPRSIQTFKACHNMTGKVHPTQKPVALMEYLIKTYTNEGEAVLDFTMGSGTAGVACKNLTRDFIGIELDSEYFKIAEKRINDVSKGTLWESNQIT